MIAKKISAALAITAAVAVAAPRHATARPVVWFEEGGARREGLPQALEAPFDDAYEARSRKTKETRKAASCRQLLELPKGFEPVGPEVDFQAFVAGHVRCQVLSALQQATPAQVEHLGPFAINDALLDELPAVFVPTPSDDEAKELAAATAKGLSWKQRDRALRVGNARSGDVTVESRKTWNRLRVVARGDLDGDGIEDVVVLRTGGGQRGSWATTDAYVLTRRAPARASSSSARSRTRSGSRRAHVSPPPPNRALRRAGLRRPLRRPVSWCPEATWQLRVGNLRVLYRIEAGDVLVLRVKIQGICDDRGDGVMTWHTQEEIDAIAREGVTERLTELIRHYDGSPDTAKEILRGLAAARSMDMDCRPFEDEIAERHRALNAA